MRSLGWDVLVYGALYALIVLWPDHKQRRAERDNDKLRWN